MSSRAATTLLPNGENCFQKATGPISSGSVNMYIPSTTTTKTTWKDTNQISANTNPIQLDANGCAVIYGIGVYRQQVFDGPVVGGVTTGNLIYDQLTTDTSAFNSVFWAGLAGGTANAITITDVGFNGTDGSVINFVALATNTSSATLNPSGFGNVPLRKDTTGGPAVLTGGEITAGNTVSVIYSQSANTFTIVTIAQQSNSGSTAPLCGSVGTVISNVGGFATTRLLVQANQAVMVSAFGQIINRSNLQFTIDTTTNGANGLDTGARAASKVYNIFLIDNGGGAAAIASLSATAPALPLGYTYQCRIGAVVTDGSANLIPGVQNGNVYELDSSHAISFTGPAGNCATVTGAAINLSSIILPPTVIGVTGFVYQDGTAGTSVLVFRAGGGVANSEVAGILSSPTSSTFLYFKVLPFGSPAAIYWCASSSHGALIVSGWTDGVSAN